MSDKNLFKYLIILFINRFTGNKLIKYNGAYYQPILKDGEDAYEVVKYSG